MILKTNEAQESFHGEEIQYERLLSQHKFLKSRTTTPHGRFYKDGWYEQHKQHNKLLKEKKQYETLIIGDSLVYGLRRYNTVWEHFFKNITLNCGIRGDRLENTLWRAENLDIPLNIQNIVILCGTNNIDSSPTTEIVNGLYCLAGQKFLLLNFSPEI